MKMSANFKFTCMHVSAVHDKLHTIKLTNQAGLQSVPASGYITLCDCGAQVHPAGVKKKFFFKKRK